jgi:hypothetical protein
VKALLLTAALLGLGACSGDKENGCAQAHDALVQAQAVYDATAGMAPDIRAQAKQALDLAWIAMPVFCEDRPAISPAN